MNPTPEEVERRQRLVAIIRVRRMERVITPLTTSERIRQARSERKRGLADE